MIPRVAEIDAGREVRQGNMIKVVERPIGIAIDVIGGACGRYEGFIDAPTYSTNSMNQKCQKNNHSHGDELRMKMLWRTGFVTF